LDNAKDLLCQYYQDNYLQASGFPAVIPQPIAAETSSGLPQKVNFTAWYKKHSMTSLRDELEEYYRLPMEDFDACDPIQWWAGCHSQFPNLSQLACDILAIPGSAVAVERIFSGGCDTISLWRASLQPNTIRTLMLLKQCLRLTHNAITVID
jgi:hypothetical protein